jgi:hypothetical protein
MEIFAKTHLRGGFEHLCGETGLGANANSMVLSDLLEEFIFRPGLGVVIDLKALLPERLDGALADIFEEEQAEFTSCEWAQHAWLEHVVGGLGRRDLVDRELALAAEARVQIAG